MWEVYIKDKQELIRREFLVVVLHPKGVEIFQTSMKDNVVGEKEDYKENGLRNFDYNFFEELGGGEV